MSPHRSLHFLPQFILPCRFGRFPVVHACFALLLSFGCLAKSCAWCDFYCFLVYVSITFFWVFLFWRGNTSHWRGNIIYWKGIYFFLQIALSGPSRREELDATLGPARCLRLAFRFAEHDAIHELILHQTNIYPKSIFLRIIQLEEVFPEKNIVPENKIVPQNNICLKSIFCSMIMFLGKTYLPTPQKNQLNSYLSPKKTQFPWIHFTEKPLAKTKFQYLMFVQFFFQILGGTNYSIERGNGFYPTERYFIWGGDYFPWAGT